MTISYTDLCIAGGMESWRASYFSGRGATTSDLNSQILSAMYEYIETNAGQEPANNFVRMVADIKVLSATDFLLNLEQLVANNFQYDAPASTNGIAVDSFGSALGTVAEVLGGRDRRDDTSAIRMMFLMQHRHVLADNHPALNAMLGGENYRRINMYKAISRKRG